MKIFHEFFYYRFGRLPFSFALKFNVMNEKKSTRELNLVLIPLAIALNIGIGSLVNALKLPFYLDAVGTVLITILLGLAPGIITGVMSFVLITAFGLNPYAIYFVGTQAVIAVFTHFVASKSGFKNLWRTIFSGIGLGIVCALVSAPVIVFLFGGIEANGPGFVTAFLVKAGKTIYQSVILKGVSIEPIDKTLQCLLAVYLIRSLPASVLQRFASPSLTKNNFIK
ncbi:MAG TPA: hypothetical protein VE933_12690 [Chitinophagaceae bacterium]|nr:hypothetical protein [Chitinophagaceae bacterium]